MTQQQVDTSIQEIWALFRETEQRFRETDEKFERTDEMFKETAQAIKEMSRSVSALTGKWGRFVEGLVAPGAIAMFQERGIKIERISQRVKAHNNGNTMEIDVLGVNSGYVVLIEVKSTLGVDAVKEHLEHLKAFKQFFPEYADRQVVGAVAGIVIDEHVDRFAYRQGLFVIGQTGETVAILNDSTFTPKTW